MVKTMKIRSMITLPIIHEEESLGVLWISSLEKEFTDDEIGILKMFAEFTAIAVNNATKVSKMVSS